MYDIIPLIIILLCLAGILAIVIKKLPLLAVFDINSIPEEKAEETKKKIMEERLERKLKVLGNKIKPYFQLILNFFQRKIKSSQEKMAQLEDKYKSKAKKEVLVTKQEFQTLEAKIENILTQASNLIKNENFDAAEKKYIEILSLDAKNLAAYHGLVDLYLAQKQYQEAIATLKHLLKLNKADSQAFFDLAEIMFRFEDYDDALNNVVKALEIEPVNPKYLDLLFTISIIIANKDMAREALERLKAVNPENAKISEMEAKIQGI
jgi:tetratricopeptide (TPR) repeat protein